MKEALLYEKPGNNDVRCLACRHQCLISPGKSGLCGVRKNEKGKLYTLVYGKIVALNLDPIEKKPLFHFLPGTYSLSLAAVGCNFSCLHCQNYDISQGLKKNGIIAGEEMSPERIVDLAVEHQVPSISYTYTEPTVFFEYALEIMKLAKKQGLKNVWVSNGYFSPYVLKAVIPYLDAINVDLKFFDSGLYRKICGGKLEHVLDNLKLLKENKVWMEITTLVIPGYTDKNKQLEKISSFIKKELGEEIPWHVSAFYPCYKMHNVPAASLELIRQTVELGRKNGLRYVYAGNLDFGEDTFCPKCGYKAIGRRGYEIKNSLKSGNLCPRCGEKIAGVFQKIN